MRDLLTYLGIGLILVLTALLGAPYVIDFDAHRGRFAEEISKALGSQAQLDGPIEFRVLPTPYFSAQKLSLKGPLGVLKADKADFELSLPALIQGNMTFTRAELSHFALEVDGDQLRKPNASVRFDDLTLRDGILRVLHAGKPFISLDHVDLSGRLAGGEGPFDARGVFRAKDRNVSYSLSSDHFAGSRLPIKLSLGSENLGNFSFDGALDLGGGLSFDGKVLGEGAAADGPWRLEGDVLAKPEAVKLDKAALHLGEGVQAMHFAGGADYGVDHGALTVDFSGAHLDGAWADVGAGLLARAMDRAAPTVLRAQLDSLNWRGTWSRVKLARDAGGPLKIAAEGAGGARFDMAVTREGSRNWRGKGDFSTVDYPVFAADVGAPALPFRQIVVGGLFNFSGGALALSNAAVTLDRTKFTGDAAWTPATKESRAKLTAKLAASALDLASVPDYGAALGESDLDLTLDAQTAGKSEGKLSLRLLREKGFSRLERLEGKNLAGADVTASGEWKDKFSGLKGTVRLKAGELQDFATLLARLAPNDTTRLVASRAKILSPAVFNAKAEQGAYAFDGQAAATKFSASLDDRGLALDVSAPEAFDLLAQLGAPPLLSPQKLGPGQISVQTQAQGARRTVTGRAALGKINGQFDGAFRDGAVDGRLSLSGDPSSLIGGPAGNGKIDGEVESRDGRITLSKILGERGDSHFTGQLSLSSDGVSGELDVDKFSAPAFLALSLGPPAPAKPGAFWPSLSFAPVVIDPPRTKLLIHAADVAPFGVPATFQLSLAANALSVANLEAAVNGGKLRGAFDLRRQAGQATFSGEFSGEGLAVKNPALSATAAGRIKLAGSGASMAALVGALSGTGSAKLTDAIVAGAAPEAPAQVLDAQAASEKPFNAKDTVRDLDKALAGGELRLGDGEASLRLAKGELKIAREGVAFTYDLNDLSFSLDSSLPDRQGALTWSGAWASPVRKVEAAPFVAVAAAKALEREQARIARQREADRQRKAEVERRKQEEARKQAEKLQPPPAPAQ
ncbi:hypothetical protein M2323_003507 [Rhodoblastus acidophilus]|uniref:hypothetical protein n=1 Tax=Rhodoblastus acidophilus TaxID=1074 RepID=UPI002224AB86|nr:hypothetical protein [Rhodoblastus acidophilus]MCW2285676.1 hypothetical protein [Rhodoblastus acidophilus]MCW2334566.1 hypothetical protein [Rhodoblastus acidophilus]